MRLGNYNTLGRYVQGDGDSLQRIVRYDRWLQADELVTDVTATVLPVTDPPFVIKDFVIGENGDRFLYTAEGGVDKEEYEVEFTVTTSRGQVRTDIVQFEVREVPRG